RAAGPSSSSATTARAAPTSSTRPSSPTRARASRPPATRASSSSAPRSSSPGPPSTESPAGIGQDSFHQLAERARSVEVSPVSRALEDDLLLVGRLQGREPLLGRLRPAPRLVLSHHHVVGHAQNGDVAAEVEALQLGIEDAGGIEESPEGIDPVHEAVLGHEQNR